MFDERLCKRIWRRLTGSQIALSLWQDGNARSLVRGGRDCFVAAKSFGRKLDFDKVQGCALFTIRNSFNADAIAGAKRETRDPAPC